MGVQAISDSRVIEPISREAQVDQEGLTPYSKELADKQYENSNIRWMVARLADKVEQFHKGKIQTSQRELEELNNKIETLMKFTDVLDKHIKNTSKDKKIELQNESSLVEDVAKIYPHEYLKGANTILTHQQAQELFITFTRKHDQSKGEAQLAAVKINHLYEDWFEILPILRELMKEMNDHIKGIIQRSVAR